MSTFGDMLDRVQDATLRGGSGNRTQIKAELNESIKQVDALVRPTLATSVESVNATGIYSLTTLGITNITSIREIVYTPSNGAPPRVMRESTANEIRELQGFAASAAYEYADRYALEGLDTLLMYPVSTNLSDTFTVVYISRPADLVNDSDVPVGLPAEFHDLYEYACIPRSMRQTSPEETQRYMAMYDKRLGDYRKWRNRRAGARSRVVFPGPVRPRPPHNPSTDLGA